MSASAEPPRRRVFDELRGIAYVFAALSVGGLARDLTTEAGRRTWVDPVRVLLVPGVVVIAAFVVASWLYRRRIRRAPADPQPGAPRVPCPPLGWVGIAVLVAAGAGWAWFSAAALDVPLGSVPASTALVFATAAGALTWVERRAGQVLLRIDENPPHDGGLRGYLGSRPWSGEVVTRPQGVRR